MLRVWFYDPAHDSDGFINKIVAYADPPFCHCELQFPDLVACSIYMGSCVVMKARTFDPAYYTVVEVPATAEQTQLARRLCEQHRDNRTSFSSLQMLACLAPWPGSASSKYTFCSKLILGVLCDAGVLLPRASINVTPSELFRVLQHEKLPRSIPELDFREVYRKPQHQKHQTPQHQTPQHQTPQHQTPQHQTPQHQTPQHQTPRFSVPELDFHEVHPKHNFTQPTQAFELQHGFYELRI